MTEEPKNNQPDNSSGSAQEAILTLIRVALNSLSSPAFLNNLAIHPLFGNFLFTGLTSGTLASIYFFFGGNSTQISATDICDQARKSDVRVQVGVGSSDQVTTVEADSADSDVDNSLFTCKYSVVYEKDDERYKEVNNEPQLENFHIVYQVVKDNLVNSVDERAISEDDLQDYCKEEEFYIPKLRETNQYDPEVHKILEDETKLELQETEPSTSAYPVFRWKCFYKVVPKYSENRATSPTAQIPLIPVGLTLDEYCKGKFEKDGLTNFSFHHYNDPNSLHCVNPNF